MLQRVPSLRLRLLLTSAAAVAVALITVAVVAGRATGTEFERYVAANRAEVQAVVSEVAEVTGYPVVVNRIIGPAGDSEIIAKAVKVGSAKGSLPPWPDGASPGRLVPAEQASGDIILPTSAFSSPSVIAVRLPGPLKPEEIFRAAVSRALIVGVLAGGLAAALLTLALSQTILKPVQALTAAARRMAQGDLRQRVPVVARDEIGELSTAFNAMADSLDRTEQLRRTLVSDVAHELRTPLANLRGYLEALNDGVTAPTPELIASLHEEALLLSRLVDDLQELTLAEAGQLHLEPQPLALAEVVASAVQLAAPQAQARAINLQVDLPPTLPPVLADRTRLGQVLRNLLSNALAYTPPGGAAAITAVERDGVVMVQVSDTGIGIPPEHLPHVCERFYRVDRSRARSTGGTGIGLAIVKELVQAHGGQVAITSTPGVGTTVSFTLPVAPARHAVGTLAEAVPARGVVLAD